MSPIRNLKTMVAFEGFSAGGSQNVMTLLEYPSSSTTRQWFSKGSKEETAMLQCLESSERSEKTEKSIPPFLRHIPLEFIL